MDRNFDERRFIKIDMVRCESISINNIFYRNLHAQ